MIKKVVFVVLLTALLFSACGTQRSGFGYSVIDGEVTITGYVGFNKNIVIPHEIYGMPVVTIFNEAFRKKRLRSVVIPDTVTHIESQAFAENRLTSMVIPHSVTYIGGLAFARNRLTSVVIPDSVIFIHERAFEGNYAEDVATPFSIMIFRNTATIIGYSGSEKNVVIPESINGLPVVTII